MAYDDVKDYVDECVREFVTDNLIDEIVDELISQACESEEFHINPEEMFVELDAEDLFSDIIDQNEDDIQSEVQDAFYNETIYDDDCFDIIKEYGFDDAVRDYYKGLELTRCNDVAYHILSDNVSSSDVDYDDYYDNIYTGFVDAWKEYTIGCCMMSIQDADKQLTNLLFTKVVYNEDYIRFYKISSDCGFKLTFDMCLVIDSIKIKLDFIRNNEYEQALDFYCNGVKIASVEY